ncbi:Aminoacyl carrier protein [Corynebacterium capitovis DSM 44611]|uniref:phosphopantetheine-binding protein n=1 Tax=Corynebacterium capitovis TaxID=131081 RepID=UPI00036FB00F|nr:phosphopantetheine-binding protein [Corynebacterium capitovis]WKD57216.1 Aminoacyl carrier protein [Corynebacterium capitovis DSM 44611]
MTDILTEIRSALDEATRGSIDASTVDAETDLIARGMSSHQIVQWMLGIEEALDIEFEDEQLNRDTFRTIDSVYKAVDTLLG